MAAHKESGFAPRFLPVERRFPSYAVAKCLLIGELGLCELID